MVRWEYSSAELMDEIDASEILQKIEFAYRTCYLSYGSISEGSAERIIRNCIKRGHESPLEHTQITFRLRIDRGVLAELTRHRIASYTVESTRYVNYKEGIKCILPYWAQGEYVENGSERNTEAYWLSQVSEAVNAASDAYCKMIESGAQPQMARAVLPQCLACTVICTMNLRELRHFFKLRTDKAAHPDMQIIANKMLKLLRDKGLGIFFEDIGEAVNA